MLDLGYGNGGPKAAAALGEWLRVDCAADNLKNLELGGNKGLGDEGVAAFAVGVAAGGVAPERLALRGTNACPKAAAALAKWLGVEGAAANLKVLNLNNNEGLGEAEQAAIRAACPEGVDPDFN